MVSYVISLYIYTALYYINICTYLYGSSRNYRALPSQVWIHRVYMHIYDMILITIVYLCILYTHMICDFKCMCQ
jgi:hypothetical protein